MLKIDKGWKGPEYEILLVDFPWGGYTDNGTAKIGYSTMTWEQIHRFPWHYFMAPKCVVFWWTTGPFIYEQQMCLHHWIQRYGFRPLGIPYKWDKTTKEGKLIGAAGPRPRLVKPIAEDVHAFTNTKTGRTFPLLTESQHQRVHAPKATRGHHSEKPDEVPRRIVELLGDRPRAELFGRKHRPGWDVIGSESPHITKSITF